jgi:diadenosine tetraphosphate (Ap4A) HIT family hydrolase
MPSDMRREPRQPCFLRAEILVGQNMPPIQAEAHDISNSGMKLVVVNSRDIPDRFVVCIPRRHFREIVEVKRRRPNELGVVIQSYANAAKAQVARR